MLYEFINWYKFVHVREASEMVYFQSREAGLLGVGFKWTMLDRRSFSRSYLSLSSGGGAPPPQVLHRC